jgi:hypothetical protein
MILYILLIFVILFLEHKRRYYKELNQINLEARENWYQYSQWLEERKRQLAEDIEKLKKELDKSL